MAGMRFVVEQIAKEAPLGFGNNAAAKTVFVEPAREIGAESGFVDLFPEDFVFADRAHGDAELINIQMDQRLPGGLGVARVAGGWGIVDQGEFGRRRLAGRLGMQ